MRVKIDNTIRLLFRSCLSQFFGGLIFLLVKFREMAVIVESENYDGQYCEYFSPLH